LVKAPQVCDAGHEEAIKGSISVGTLADFVILAQELHEVDQGKIKHIPVVRKSAAGVTAYQA